MKKKFDYYKYNHTLEYFNTIKINSKVKNTIAIKVIKRYYFGDISINIKNIRWIANKKTLKNVEGAHLNLKKIYNASVSWKHQNPNIHIIRTII